MERYILCFVGGFVTAVVVLGISAEVHERSEQDKRKQRGVSSINEQSRRRADRVDPNYGEANHR